MVEGRLSLGDGGYQLVGQWRVERVEDRVQPCPEPTMPIC